MKKDYLTPTVHTLVLRSRSILTDGSVQIDADYSVSVDDFEREFQGINGY